MSRIVLDTKRSGNRAGLAPGKTERSRDASEGCIYGMGVFGVDLPEASLLHPVIGSAYRSVPRLPI